MLIQQIFYPLAAHSVYPLILNMCFRNYCWFAVKKNNPSITNLSLIYMNPALKCIFDVTFTILVFGNILIW